MSGLYIHHKRDFHIRTWLAAFIAVGLLGVSGWFAYVWYTTGEKPPFVPLPASALADATVDETKVTLTDIANYRVDAMHPRYISIPSLGITKARVQKVGLTKNNTLDLPRNIHDAGWYSESAFPGQGYGAVLLDGHNSGVNQKGVFANLDKLKKDAEIIIERGDGKKFTYIVVENNTETLQQANTAGMKRLLKPFDTNKEGLGIITTAGNWIPRDRIFDQRILIRAVGEVITKSDKPDTAQAPKD